MKPKRKKLAKSSRKAAALSFFLFGVIALGIVVALEFLDYRAGRYSFIFSKVIRLGRKLPAGEPFNRELDRAAGRAEDRLRSFPRPGRGHPFQDRPGRAALSPLARDLLRLVEKHRRLPPAERSPGHEGAGRLPVPGALRQAADPRHPAQQEAGRHGHAAARPKRPAATAKARRRTKSSTPRLAIIIDDIGYADLVSDQLRDLGIPLTAAVIPDAPYARSEAQRLHEYGLEEIIHLPMQPKDPANHHPARPVRPGRLQRRRDRGPAAERAMAVVPYARGVNNHMGSLLTSDPQAMRRVLELVKERGPVLRRLQDARARPSPMPWPGR